MCKFELLSLEFACIASKNWTAERTGGFIQGRKKREVPYSYGLSEFF